MRLVIRYICEGCGWVWSRDVSARMKLASIFPQPAPRIVVPASHAECCRETVKDPKATQV